MLYHKAPCQVSGDRKTSGEWERSEQSFFKGVSKSPLFRGKILSNECMMNSISLYYVFESAKIASNWFGR